MTHPWTPRIKARHDKMREVYYDADCEHCEGHLTKEAARLQARYTHVRGFISALIWSRMVPLFTVEAYTRSGPIFRRRLTLHGKTEMRAARGSRTAIGTLTFDHAANVNYNIIRHLDTGKVARDDIRTSINVVAGDSIQYTQALDRPA